MIPAALPILFEAVLRALIAACVLGALLRLLRVRNVPAQKAAWGLVLVAAISMPLMMRWQWLPSWAAVKLPTASWTRIAAPAPIAAKSSPAPVAQFEERQTNARPVASEENYDLPAISDSDFSAPVSAPAQATPSVVPVPPTPINKPAAKNLLGRLFSFAWLLYLAVGAALVLRLLFALAASIRLWLGATPLNMPPAPEFPHRIDIRSSRRIASPVNIGSSILLPANYITWDDEKLRVVLAHEYAHIRQRDYYLQLLAGLYAAVTWFSPLGWWLKRKLSELAEAISDHAGLEAAASPAAYAELLLEFAALPRPTLSGVAMARSTNLSQRIERLLNESSFRQTFAGGRRVLVSLMVPAVLVTAVSLVRVQAAAIPGQPSTVSSQPAAPQAAKTVTEQLPSSPAITVQSNHNSVQLAVAGSGPVPQDAAPQASPASAAAPVPSAAPQENPAPQAPVAPQENPAPSAPVGPHDHIDVHVPPVHVHVDMPPMPPMPPMAKFKFDFRSDETTYAVIGDPGTKTQFHGDWDVNRGEEVEKARKMAQGHFILFRNDGKSYIIDDPTIVNQVEAMDKALQTQSEQMRALSKQMRDAVEPFRDQMHDQQQQERDAERKARETASEIPTPDISKEMAELNAAVAALQAKQGGTISREQLGEIERKIAEVQRRVIDAQIRMTVKVDFDMSKFDEARSKFSEQQSQFSAQMGQLGSQIGQTARENNEKIKSIVNDSLSNGKARPVN